MPSHPHPALALLPVLGACALHPPRDWGAFDILKDPLPAAPVEVRGVPIERPDYDRLLALGEGWFRYGAFGNERSISDVMGVFDAAVDVPCASGVEGCFEKQPVFPVFLDAIDRLDGVAGNLFAGNGGPEGTGYTSDLVLYFPKGSRLYGSIPVPEELHTGLDVEAGSPLPIGIDAVPAPADDPYQSFLHDLSQSGYAGAPAGKVRFRLACAACHYSLDVDNDGHADLRSAKVDNPTPGSPYRPDHAWGVGNQDISFGWLFGLAQNPLLGAPVLAGSVGSGTDPDDALAYLRWVLATYRERPEDAKREVVAAMLAQPRGFADVTTDGIYNTMQIPTLYTRHAWPANSDGGQSAGSDRNNTVWTGALDFTGLIQLCSDRGSALALPWDPKSIFSELPCDTFADLMVRESPAAKAGYLEEYKRDVLGQSDGVPGMLDPKSVVVMVTPTFSKKVMEEIGTRPDQVRTPDDYHGDGPLRGAGLAALGMRIAVEDRYRAELAALAAKYNTKLPEDDPRRLDVEDLMSEAVSLALDWANPPPNTTRLLVNAAPLVARGQEVFRASGCETCHRGPFATDNVIHTLSRDPAVTYGLPRVATTAGWRVIDRGRDDYIETEPQRSQNTRNLRRLISAPYDPVTGLAYRKGGPLRGLLSVQNVGYKTTPLRFLWGSAPYLHDGGVGVALRPDSPPAGDDLATLLRRAGTPDVLYGMGEALTLSEPDPWRGPRANAALSLQALVLRSERERVVAANERVNYTVWPGSRLNVVTGGPALTTTSVQALGIHGAGHDFYLDDVPGGPDVTALVAFLLALDDAPRELPTQAGGSASPADRPTPY